MDSSGRSSASCLNVEISASTPLSQDIRLLARKTSDCSFGSIAIQAKYGASFMIAWLQSRQIYN